MEDQECPFPVLEGCGHTSAMCPRRSPLLGQAFGGSSLPSAITGAHGTPKMVPGAEQML